MHETASAFSAKTLFINLKVYSSKTKNTEAIHQTKTVISSPLMTEWAWPVIKLPQAHQFDHRFSGLCLATREKSTPATPLNFQEPRRPQSKGDLDVGRWSGLNIF